MIINNYQKKVWKGNFGEEFTKRNTFKSYDDWNNFYKIRYNLTKEEINKDFLGKLPINKNLRIQSDEGRPICIVDSNDDIANVFSSIAQAVHKKLTN